MTLERAMVLEHRMDQTEDELIERAADGDREALQVLLIEHCVWLPRHIDRQLPDDMRGVLSVDDLVQDTLVEVFRSIGQLRSRGRLAFAAWIKSVADNRTRNAVRDVRCKKRGGNVRRVSAPHSSSVADLTQLLSDHGETPSRPMVRNELVAAVHVGLAGLPEEQRDAVRLRLLDGKSLEETATALERTPAAVRGMLYRAKQSMRQALGRSSRWFGKNE
jgi:RNA polymerase sigma-70 factor (ECF subfamily)